MGGCISGASLDASSSVDAESHNPSLHIVVPSSSGEHGGPRVGQSPDNYHDQPPALGLPGSLIPPISAIDPDAKELIEGDTVSSSADLSKLTPSTISLLPNGSPSSTDPATPALATAAILHSLPAKPSPSSSPEKGSFNDNQKKSTAKDEESGSSSSDDEDDDSNNRKNGDDDDDDDDDENDDAELSPERAREIAQLTASITIVHSIPPKKCRGILSTENLKNGCSRPLTASAIASRKKGLRWNITEGMGLWSERAATPTAAMMVAARAVQSPSSPKASAKSKNAGEKWIAKNAASPGKSSPLSPARPRSSLSISTSPGGLGLKNTSSNVNIEPSTPPTPLSARQYTSSARIAGSNSFKARLNFDRSADTNSTSNLSNTLATSSNYLLRFSIPQLIHLNWISLQQLFLLYSKSGRSFRDKNLESASTTGMSSRNSSRKPKKSSINNQPLNQLLKDEDSMTKHHHHGKKTDTSGDLFLISAGLESALPSNSATTTTATASSSTQSQNGVAWIELDSSCSLAFDEMNALALHLVQKKLEIYLKELTELSTIYPQIITGKNKITQLFKATRFSLFPLDQSYKKRNKNGSNGEVPVKTKDPKENLKEKEKNAVDSPTAALLHMQQSNAFAQYSSLNESEILQLFISTTYESMQYFYSTYHVNSSPKSTGSSSVHKHVNNFGEITWEGMMDMNCWKKFTNYFFFYRAEINPLGLSPQQIQAAQQVNGTASHNGNQPMKILAPSGTAKRAKSEESSSACVLM